MKMHWQELAVLAMTAAAGCMAAYARLQRRLRRDAVARQQATEHQLDAMAVTIKTLEARIAELSAPMATAPRSGPAREVELASVAAAAAAEVEAQIERASIAPEILAVIVATATAFVGREIRLRSARLQPATAGAVNPWSQQGRAVVQASHNVRPRR